MFVNIIHDTPREHRRLAFFGVVMLTSMSLLIGLSIAIYQKVFEPVTLVTVQADRAGLQLQRFGDVRVNGVLVGQVRAVGFRDDLAEITLGLRPAAARQVPSDATVEILPTTLFGQKYVALQRPQGSTADPIEDGAVIGPDRVTTNVELNRILANLFPLLRAVRPGDLNRTLGELARALEGRGEGLGSMLEDLGVVVADTNEDLPVLQEDLRLLAEVADVYRDATPDLLRALDGLTVTGATVVDQQAELGRFFDDVGGVARTGARVLRDNREGLISFGEVSRPLLRLLDTYAPQYPCLLRGLDRYTDRLAEIFRGDTIRQAMEVGASQKESYTKDDKPKYADRRGPWCSGLPNPPVPIGPEDIKDGSDKDSAPRQSQAPYGILPEDLAQLLSTGPGNGYAGTRAEQGVVNALLAERTGRPVTDFGSLATLLHGPLLRGTEVTS
ncbi:MAG: MCE family protein [Nocardioides sp.]|nr:MCE family protein [Nocardioides sp.]